MAEPAQSGHSNRGATFAMIEGRSARAVLQNTIRDVAKVPTLLSSYATRRDKSAWVIGNIHGFGDNPRYLAEYIHNSRPNLKLTWIAHDGREADSARAAGLTVVLRGSADARRVQRRAGVAVFTHGFRDLDLEHLGGARLVFVWHGTPLKRIGLDVQIGARRRSIARLASHLVRWVHKQSFRLVSVFVASGDLEKRRFESAFAAPPKRVPVLGSPRFDVILGGPEYDRIVRGDLRQKLGYAADDRIVLWLPTHRKEYGDDRWVPQLTTEQLDQVPSSARLRLLAKPHPLADLDVFRQRLPADDERVKLLAASEVDVNCLLHIADALITDYSSVVCDFAILSRPVYFLAPDVEMYSGNRGLYDPYERLTDNRHHRDWASTLTAIREDVESQDGAEGKFLVQRINEYLGLRRDNDASGVIVDAISSWEKRP